MRYSQMLGILAGIPILLVTSLAQAQKAVPARLRQTSQGQAMPRIEPRCSADCVVCPDHGCCPNQCGCRSTPCQPPAVPRGAPTSRDATPRDAAPPANPGVYVAPPQTGEIVGPRQGLEMGGMSITLPEMSISLPKFRFQGISRFARSGHMRMDSGIAPLVPHPFGAAQQTVATQQDTQRSAEPEEEEETTKSRDAETPTPPNPRNAPTCAKSDLDKRIDRLERCVEMQCEALQACIEKLNKAETVQPNKATATPPAAELPCPVKPQATGTTMSYVTPSPLLPRHGAPPPGAAPAATMNQRATNPGQGEYPTSTSPTEPWPNAPTPPAAINNTLRNSSTHPIGSSANEKVGKVSYLTEVSRQEQNGPKLLIRLPRIMQ